MDTIELGVANDPRPDAGLGRLSTDEDRRNKGDGRGAEHKVDHDDVESQNSAEGTCCFIILMIIRNPTIH